ALKKENRASELLKRPEVEYLTLTAIDGLAAESISPDVAEQVEIQAKYAGYVDKQKVEIEKTRRYESKAIPDSIDYADVKGLSNEVRQKLQDHRPSTLGQAGRIPGVTPAAVSLLLVYLKKNGGALAKSA
ncbi:MAG: tRNA uridine-5-carboxymethylaminomethyl(34) synthesis enzyme MnmG, partial [Gammaproteobacteria bacterium]|nr:tRNA uridine-5-carboxymethylaminomethyl(34) synthesis enzyme MnmG [Gammaproteobacteria bacterium]